MMVTSEDLKDLRREANLRPGGLWFLYDGDGREWMWWLVRLCWCAVLLVPFTWAPWPTGTPRLGGWLQTDAGKGLLLIAMLGVWRLVRLAADGFFRSVQAQGWRRTQASGAYWRVAMFFLPFLFILFAGNDLGAGGWVAFLAFQLCLLLAFMLLLELFAGLRRISEAQAAAASATQRLRLEPHFLFNVLNGIQAQIPRDPESAAVALDKVSRLQRRLLELVEKPLVTLEEELAFVEAYLGLQRLRFGPKLQVAVEVPEAAEGMLVPTLSLHILVENAIKHGIARRPEGGQVRIWARVEPRYDAFSTSSDLTVGVENDAGSAPDPLGTGTGLVSLRARLQEPSDLQLEQVGTRFRATLHGRQP